MAAFSEPTLGSAADPVLADETAIPRPHPKTGERRRARQPLRLDRLPLALLDRIRAERAQGRTWTEIERDSPSWPEWEQVTPEVLADFPGRRLPHTSLQRWHDLRVDQVQNERERQSVMALACVADLAARGLSGLGSALCNVLADSVFRLRLEGGDEQRLRDEVCRVAQVVAIAERGQIARQKLELERRKVELAAQQEQAEVDRLLAENQMAPSQLSHFVHGMANSPAFDPYLKAWADMQEGRDAANAEEAAEKAEDHLEPEPDHDPEPDDDPESDDQPEDEDEEDDDSDWDDEPGPDDEQDPEDEPGPEDAESDPSPRSPAISRDLP
jgi:hypothetical protein